MKEVQQSKEPVGLLAWHPDRLARNSIDGGQIIYSIDIEKIVSLRFPTFWFEPTPQGLFMLQVAFGQSKYYSDNLSENVKRGVRQKLRRGEWPTKAPFGYVNNPKTRNIEPDELKSRAVKKVFAEFATGNYTLASMSECLSFWGVVSGTGKPLAKAQMHRILTNNAYLGMIEHNGESYEGKFSALIDMATFEAVQKILKSRARPRKKKESHNFPFTGLLTCQECNAAITAQFAHGHGGTYRYYRCTKRLGPCSQKYVQEKELATQIKTQLQTVAISDDWHSQGLAQIEQWEKELKNNNASFVQNLETKTQETDKKLNMLVDSYLDGTIEKEIYLVKKEELIKQKTDFNRKKSDFGRKGISWIEPMRTFWKAAHYAKKLAASNDFLEIKSFVAEHGTNRRLGGRKLFLLWGNSWPILAGRTERSELSG
jgi:site-specific DNA recombinase